jgi:Predicted transcriptional regulators
MEQQSRETYTVGELARGAGVTVRALQYYDRCGLLNPAYTEGGRRLYSRHDVILLQQILFLKSFGFTLDEIRDRLLPSESPEELERLLTRQKQALQEQIASLQRTEGMMEKVIAEIHTGSEIGADKFVALMWLMSQGKPLSFIFRYFGNDDVRRLMERFNTPDSMEEFNRSSESLFAELLQLYRAGVDPAETQGQRFAADWWKMVSSATNGDPGLLKTLISAGEDVEHWPDEAQEFKLAIQTFLQAALEIYLKENKIHLRKDGPDE